MNEKALKSFLHPCFVIISYFSSEFLFIPVLLDPFEGAKTFSVANGIILSNGLCKGINLYQARVLLCLSRDATRRMGRRNNVKIGGKLKF